MKIKYAFQIGAIKFLSRLTSNILSGCSIILAVVLILVCVMAVEGIINVIKTIYKDTLMGRNFAVVLNIPEDQDLNSNTIYTNFEFETVEVPQDKVKERFESTTVIPSVSEDDVYNPYYYSSSSGYIMMSKDDNKSIRALPLDFTHSIFIQDSLYKDYTFENDYDGKIPVIVPITYIESEDISKIYEVTELSNEERFEKLRSEYNKYIGQTFKVTEQFGARDSRFTEFDEVPEESVPQVERSEELENVEFIIVGFSSSIPIGDYRISAFDNDYAISIPLWAVDENEEIREIFEDKDNERTREKRFYYEFYKKADRDQFVDKNFLANYAIGPIEATSRFTNVLLRIVYVIGGFILTISTFLIFITINKAVLDSKKEIGVFRSIGAKTWAIRKIYFAYSLILVNLSFAVGFLISVGINTIPSIMWGDDLFYSFAAFSANFDARQPLLVFVNIPLSILVFYVIIQLIGLLAAFIPSIRATRINPIDALREE